jgi:hypothetical protein
VDTALNSITVLGQAINVNADTTMVDRIASADQPAVIALSSLNPADRLEVKAYKDTAGALVATRVERTAASPLVVVKGPADAKVPTTGLTLAGFGVETGVNTLYRDVNQITVDAATFYGAVQVPPAVPSIVHARGVVATLATNVVDATRSNSTVGELELADEGN